MKSSVQVVHRLHREHDDRVTFDLRSGTLDVKLQFPAPGDHLAIETLPGGGNQQKSKKSTEDFVQGNKDLRAIFAINDPSALGAYTALKQVGLEKQVTIVGFDGEQAGKQAIKDGKIFADPVQYPDKMAQITIQSIFEYFDGKKPEKLIKIPAELYFKEDADKDPALK